MLLTSCSSTATSTAGGSTQAPAGATGGRPKVDASAPLSTSAADLAAAIEDDSPAAEATLYRGNDRQVKLPAPEKPIRFVGEDVSINFETAPLSEVMHAIMGDILQLDYVVDMPIAAAVGVCTANLAFGGGSVFQYYVPDWEGRIYTTGRTFRFGAGSY